MILVGVLGVVVGFTLLFLSRPEPSLPDLLRTPGFVLLAALVAFTDCYRLVPWLRDVRFRPGYPWSVVLSLAAVIAFGPAAVVLLALSGVVDALIGQRRNRRRAWVNLIKFGWLALGVAGVNELILLILGTPLPRESGQVGGMVLAGVLLAVTVMAGYVVLRGVLAWAADPVEWRTELAAAPRTARVWGISLLVSPLLAAMALWNPMTLPLVAVAVVAVHEVSASVVRTAVQAGTDPLTGLPNRQSFHRELRRRIAQLARKGRPVGVIVVDLDGFKAVNDTFGHLVGDEVLAAVGRRLAEAAGPRDLVARIGGDEFAVLAAPGTVSRGVRTLADQLGAAIERPLQLTEVRLELGGSVGWSITDDPAADPADLLHGADQAMYRNKREHRRLPVSVGPVHRYDVDGRVVSGAVTGSAALPDGWGRPMWSVSPQGGASAGSLIWSALRPPAVAPAGGVDAVDVTRDGVRRGGGLR
ncbi:GGDEF domain-containing protein [Nakamurella leprariae]|uniref:Diguanylate cyclase n=1 Tax=Nakamurella leprariae TaxID=2803911 RepID=A0A939C3H0_9ACTN|nr:sensor domain-containing diguanylate cyclase [Nakamurella leprariae]MBM9469092.1 diguanylate cyclase [Nakamurella leprariae]